MTTFNDREAGFEAAFVHDADMEFRVNARRNRLFGEWAAAKLGMSGDDAVAYGKAVVRADFEAPGEDDVLRKVVGDLADKGVAVTEVEVRAAMGTMLIEARRQLMDAS